METRIFKMLTDGGAKLSDDAYDAMEAETRAALIALYVKPECSLKHDKGVAENNHASEDRFLYLGSHQCSTDTMDDCDEAYVELWAWIDDNGADFVTWNITTVCDESKYPIKFCPFCGVDLWAWIND